MRSEQDRLLQVRVAYGKSVADVEERFAAELAGKLARARGELDLQYVARLSQATSVWGREKAAIEAKALAEQDTLYFRIARAFLRLYAMRAVANGFLMWRQWARGKAVLRHVLQKLSFRVEANIASSVFSLWRSWSCNHRRVRVLSARHVQILGTRVQAKCFSSWRSTVDQKRVLGQLLRKAVKRVALTRTSFIFWSWKSTADRNDALGKLLQKIFTQRVDIIRTRFMFSTWITHCQHRVRTRQLRHTVQYKICRAQLQRTWSYWLTHRRKVNRLRQITHRLRHRIISAVVDVWIGMVVQAQHDAQLMVLQSSVFSPSRISMPEEDSINTPTTSFEEKAPLPSSSAVFDSPITPGDPTRASSVNRSLHADNFVARRLVLTPTESSALEYAFEVKQQHLKLLRRVISRLVHSLSAKAFGSWTLYYKICTAHKCAVQRGLRGVRRWRDFAKPVADGTAFLDLAQPSCDATPSTQGISERSLELESAHISVQAVSFSRDISLSAVHAGDSDNAATPPAATMKHNLDNQELAKQLSQKPAETQAQERQPRPTGLHSSELLSLTPEINAASTPASEALVPAFVPFRPGIEPLATTAVQDAASSGAASSASAAAAPLATRLPAQTNPSSGSILRNCCDKNEQLMSLKYRNQLKTGSGARLMYHEKAARPHLESQDEDESGTIASVAAWAKEQKRKKDAAVLAASAARYSEPVNHAFDADFVLELELPEVKFSLDEPGAK